MLCDPQFTGEFAYILSTYFGTLSDISNASAFTIGLHKLDAAHSILCVNYRNKSIWLGEITLPEHLLLLFRTFLLHNDDSYTAAPLPRYATLVRSARICNHAALILSRSFSPTDPECISKTRELMHDVTSLQIQYSPRIMPWTTLLASIAVLDLTSTMNQLSNAVAHADTIPSPSPYASHQKGAVHLPNPKKTAVANLLLSSQLTCNIPISNMKLISLSAGTVISSYPPGADEITFISSAQPLSNQGSTSRPRSSFVLSPHTRDGPT